MIRCLNIGRNWECPLLLSCAFTVFATSGLSTHAQEANSAAGENPNEPVMLDTLVVTATKTARDAYSTLAGSSAVGRDEIELQHQGGSVADIVSGIPGVTTQTSGDDPGTAINLRGLQDFGRVNVIVDGARQNFQKSGHEANGSFYLDGEMLKSVDVTRGPVASIYGSGAIGGVVSFTTLDAGDVLLPGETYAVRGKAMLQSNGFGPLAHAETAYRAGEKFDVLAAGTWQTSDDYESGGGDEVQSAQELLSGLIKGRFRPVDGHEFTVSGQRYDNSFDNGSADPRDTTVDTNTYTAGYRYTPGDHLWDLNAKLYYTRTIFDQDAGDQPGAGKQTFDTRTIGGDLYNTTLFKTAALSHEFTYGGDVFRDSVHTQDETGTSDDLTPPGERWAYGAFVQDSFSYSDWLEIIGGLRFDGYRLSGNDTETEGTRLSPKVTVGVTPWSPMTLYATYAEGYRAPAITETLIEGFHPPPVSSGTFFPNPDLKPEVAHTIEGGVNFRFNELLMPGDRLRLKASVFRNDVADYIDQVFVLFPIPGGYQYQNIAEARLEGIEIEGNYDTGRIFGGLSASVIDGEDRKTGEELQKVPPNRMSATLGFRAFDNTLTAGGRLTLVDEKENAEALGFIGDAYETFDLFAAWTISQNVTANLALNNIFDRDYTQYLNADPSPGFNAKASLTVRFGGT